MNDIEFITNSVIFRTTEICAHIILLYVVYRKTFSLGMTVIQVISCLEKEKVVNGYP